MSVKLQKQWSCDRCGFRLATTGAVNMPDGWTKLVVGRNVDKNGDEAKQLDPCYHICGKCVVEFQTWFNVQNPSERHPPTLVKIESPRDPLQEIADKIASTPKDKRPWP